MEGSKEAAGRSYKSRKSRPCDACRRRKVTCIMPSGPPCHRCCGKTLSCTFEHGPGERKRPAPELVPATAHGRLDAATLALSSPPRPRPSSGHGTLDPALPPAWMVDPAFFSDQLSRSWGFPGPFNLAHGEPDPIDVDGVQLPLPWHMQQMHHERLVFPATPTLELPDYHRGPLQRQTPPNPPPSFTRSSTTSSNISGPASRDRAPPATSATDAPRSKGFSTNGSLEFLPGAFSFYIGPTGVADIHLLGREAFGSDGVTELSVKGLKYRRMQRGTDQSTKKRGRTQESCTLSSGQEDTSTPPVIFGLTDHALLDKAEPKPDAEATESAWLALWKILSPQTAWSLIQLYARFVDPYFPILACHQIPQDPNELSNMPLALLTAICATALPFVIHDHSLYALLLRPPSSETLYRLCWQGIAQELHTPSLSTVQACLLLQQRLPTNLYLNDTAFSWSLMATAVSAAQTIGLHRDPSNWTTVPAWERRLRRRLWWALWAMEKWVALARGMPSHLVDDEADVEPMHPDDINETLSDPARAQPHLYHLVSLTLILAEIQKTYYTVRATRQTQRNLALSLEVGRATRVRLKAWHESLPEGLQQSRTHRQATHPDSHDSSSSGSGGNSDNNASSDDRHQGGGGSGGGSGTDCQQLDGSASLHLFYIVTHMTLFRALLRPLETGSHQSPHAGGSCCNEGSPCVNCDGRGSGPGTQAVMRGALLCIREFVEFVEVLTPTQWNAFWHGCSRANFAIAGSFMVQLLHIVSTERSATAAQKSTTDMDVDSGLDLDDSAADRDAATASPHAGPALRPGFADEYRELVGWIKRWRWASRVSATGAAGAKGLTNLGLLRVETFIGQLGGLDDD